MKYSLPTSVGVWIEKDDVIGTAPWQWVPHLRHAPSYRKRGSVAWQVGVSTCTKKSFAKSDPSLSSFAVEKQ